MLNSRWQLPISPVNRLDRRDGPYVTSPRRWPFFIHNIHFYHYHLPIFPQRTSIIMDYGLIVTGVWLSKQHFPLTQRITYSHLPNWTLRDLRQAVSWLLGGMFTPPDTAETLFCTFKLSFSSDPSLSPLEELDANGVKLPIPINPFNCNQFPTQKYAHLNKCLVLTDYYRHRYSISGPSVIFLD